MPTGFGKTNTAIMAIRLMLKKFEDLKVIIVVPTDLLQEQWKSKLDINGLSLNCEVLVINTAIKTKRTCDMLVIDEIHRTGADKFSEVFNVISYKYILGLTATLERLDGRHIIINRYCPIVDVVTTEEAVANGWMAKNVEYKVILNVTDIGTYQEMQREFSEHFEFFNYNFNLVTSLLGKKGLSNRLNLRNEMFQAWADLQPYYTEEQAKQRKTEILRDITLHAVALMRVVQARKKFIYNHPDKLRLTREIIKYRPNAKIITFSATVDVANKIGVGYVYSGKDSKKKGRTTIEEFGNLDSGVLNTVAKANEG